MRKPTPKSVVLDLLRVTPRSLALPVSVLVEVGALFGFEGNAVRVAIARLVGKGLVTSDERGFYRQSPTADSLAAWVEEWRTGEARRLDWSGHWLAAVLTSPPRARRTVERPLERIGFRRSREKLWVRPANLVGGVAVQRSRLAELGAHGAELFCLSDASADVEATWATSLWDTKTRHRKYRAALKTIYRSRSRLDSLAIGAGLLESFVVGGDAIRLLSRDPLLPEDMEAGDLRRELTEAMLDYDERGRALWSQTLTKPSRSPRHLPAESAHA